MRYFYLMLALFMLMGCGDSAPSTPPVQAEPEATGYQFSQSSMSRELHPGVSSADFQQLIDDNNDFALQLYHWQAADENNLFFAPISVSVAMAMTYAGARAQTATEMAAALNFQLPDEQLHAAFNQWLLHVDGVANGEHPMTLMMTQASWLEQTFEVLPEYLDQLAVHYDAGVYQVDFRQQPEQARVTMNRWVEQQTDGKLSELLAAGSVDTDTRLMLLNTMLFQANWALPFEPEKTRQAEFHQLNGHSEQVSMMQQDAVQTSYTEGAGYQAMRLPYANQQFSMLLLLPAEGNFTAFEAELDLTRLQHIRQQLTAHLVDVRMPSFQLEHEVNLTSALQDFGMHEAFQAGMADFSGIDGSQTLLIDSAVHQAVIDVDEYGTEAAAATAVHMGVTNAPPWAELTINRPFIFLIEEHETGSILFMGRVLQP